MVKLLDFLNGEHNIQIIMQEILSRIFALKILIA